jgi:hypothetical protein
MNKKYDNTIYMLLKVNSITSQLKNNISKTVDKLFKSDKVQSKNHAVLHNIYILYLIFVIALGDFLYLVYTGDLYSATIFVLVGFLTYFFSKNMIVILFIALAITNIIKCGRCSEEGFEDGEGDAEGKAEGEGDAEGEGEDENKDEEKSMESEAESTEKPKKTEESQKPTPIPTTSVPTKTPTSTADEFSLSVENATNEKKEQFGQDTKVVYTSEEDREIQKTEKMMATQEKMLKSMNKYKPLLDTLNGLTRNIAAVKGTTDSLTKDSA